MGSGLFLVYAAVGLTAIMIAEALYLLFSSNADRRAAINRRMKLRFQQEGIEIASSNQTIVLQAPVVPDIEVQPVPSRRTAGLKGA